MQEAAATPAEPAGESTKIMKKLLPLGAMFFFILFNYTILRDTKDVLVVTAPGSGAEIIPFLKTYVNLPGAIAFTALYAKLTNKYSRQQVFNGVVGTFLVFFALFATVIYPNAAMLHPTAWCQWLAALLPAGFAAPIAIIQNWTYAVFYTMAELWGSVVASLLFWGFANELTSVPEAKKYCASRALPPHARRPPVCVLCEARARLTERSGAAQTRSSASAPTSPSSSPGSTCATSPGCGGRGWRRAPPSTRGAPRSST